MGDDTSTVAYNGYPILPANASAANPEAATFADRSST